MCVLSPAGPSREHRALYVYISHTWAPTSFGVLVEFGSSLFFTDTKKEQNRTKTLCEKFDIFLFLVYLSTIPNPCAVRAMLSGRHFDGLLFLCENPLNTHTHTRSGKWSIVLGSKSKRFHVPFVPSAQYHSHSCDYWA